MLNKIWESEDRTGGPLDAIISTLRSAFQDLRVERLQVAHPADDDNVWFISRASTERNIQIDSTTNGQPPFLIESDRDRARTEDVDEAIALLKQWLLRSS